MKKALCILLALLMVGCTVPAAQSEEVPQPPIEDVVLETTEPVAQLEEPLEGIWSEELTALMEEINAEHRAVEKVSLDGHEKYIQTELKNATVTVAEPNEDGSFSAAQAEADLQYFFDYLRGNYGLYLYFGGDEVFGAAKEEILRQVREEETLTVERLSEILWENMRFIQDGHFSIDNKGMLKSLIPHFFIEIPFHKTENGYYSEDGKLVTAVEGYDDLDLLFKRSLSRDGNIVYYPVVMMEHLNRMSACPPLQLTYADTSTQMLFSEPYQRLETDITESEVTRMSTVEGIKSFTSIGCYMKRFSEAAKELKTEPLSIVDLRFNRGGNYTTLSEWFVNYAGRQVPAHCICIGAKLPEEQDLLQGYMKLEHGKAIFADPDDFVSNDSLLVVLTSKRSASGAELFVDMTHNLENTLIIGENTAGCLQGTGGMVLTLPYSRLKFSCGTAVNLWPEGQFSEGYGLEPDLWCPAVYAEEAAINFLKKNVQ